MFIWDTQTDVGLWSPETGKMIWSSGVARGRGGGAFGVSLPFLFVFIRSIVSTLFSEFRAPSPAGFLITPLIWPTIPSKEQILGSDDTILTLVGNCYDELQITRQPFRTTFLHIMMATSDRTCHQWQLVIHWLLPWQQCFIANQNCLNFHDSLAESNVCLFKAKIFNV